MTKLAKCKTNKERVLLTILKETGKEDSFNVISHSDGWMIELVYPCGSRFIHGYTFPINNAASAKLCDDKSGLSEVLISKQIPTIHHHYFMNPKSPYHTDKQWECKVIDLLHHYKTIVVKPNNGTGGDDVYRVSTVKQLKTATTNIFNRFDAMAISPFVCIQNEYRVIVLNNEVQLVYMKKRLDNEWRHNLQLGAQPIIVKDKKVLNVLSKIALRSAQAINITFASIDIVEVDGEYKVLEINSGVMLEKFASASSDNYRIAKAIYQAALKQK